MVSFNYSKIMSIGLLTIFLKLSWGKKLYCQTVYSIICREFASHELIPGAVSLTAQFSYAH